MARWVCFAMSLSCFAVPQTCSAMRGPIAVSLRQKIFSPASVFGSPFSFATRNPRASSDCSSGVNEAAGVSLIGFTAGPCDGAAEIVADAEDWAAVSDCGVSDVCPVAIVCDNSAVPKTVTRFSKSRIGGHFQFGLASVHPTLHRVLSLTARRRGAEKGYFRRRDLGRSGTDCRPAGQKSDAAICGPLRVVDLVIAPNLRRATSGFST